MSIRISRYAHHLSIAAVLIAALVSVRAAPADASGPGAAAAFVALSDGTTDIATSRVAAKSAVFKPGFRTKRR